MKSKWKLFSAIFQLTVGILAIFVFIILACNGEIMTKWIITLILAIAYIVLGTIELICYKSNR